MNAYQMIMKLQEKMKNPTFAQKFNSIANELNNMPGLQQEVMRIAQIQDEKKRQQEVDKLPARARAAAKEMFDLLNS